MRSWIKTAFSRSKHAAIGAALGAAVGGLLSRSAASTGGAVGGLVGAIVGETRVTAGSSFTELKETVRAETGSDE
jgi:Na+/H+ antiporter NhaC